MEVSRKITQEGYLLIFDITATITLAIAAAPAQNLMMFTGDYNAFVNAYSYAGNFVQVVSIPSLSFIRNSFPCHSAS